MTVYTCLSWNNGLPVVTVKLGKTVLFSEEFQNLSDALVCYAEHTNPDPDDE